MINRAFPVLACAVVLAAGASPFARGAAAQTAAPESLAARFYERREGRPAWLEAGFPSTDAWQLLGTLAAAGDDGLEPNDYGVHELARLAGSDLARSQLERFDSLLTTAFFAYARDLAWGRVAPQDVNTNWTSASPPFDLVPVLERAVAARDVAGTLRALAPPYAEYEALRRALTTYRIAADAGGFPPAAPLRRRLEAEGYRAGEGDSALAAALRAFQARHGLAPDGVLDRATLAALDVPAAARARQIALNLERWRWMTRTPGPRYIIVNSAGYTLEVMDGGRPALRLRAIAGRPDWPTPIVSARVTEVVFQPRWWIPRTIAVEEVLPHLRRDPRWGARQGIRVFASADTGAREIDPATVDWRRVTARSFAYQLVQDPGPANPLGRLKLVFRSPFNVFIHDTPDDGLFAERRRSFSHGCVRVEHAASLAAYLLAGWDPDSLAAAMREADRGVRLPEPVPVHLVYWTAWAGDDGIAEFRDDVYGWDERLDAALRQARTAGAGTYPPRPPRVRGILPDVIGQPE